MHSKITKYGTAAVIIVAAVLSVNIFNNTMPTAYAIEQTLEACHSVRYIHIQSSISPDQESGKTWVEFDKAGQVKNARIDLPEWAGGGDGPKLIIWKENKAQLWMKKKKKLVTIKDETIAAQMVKMAEQFDPKRAVERLQSEEEQGKIELEIEEPKDKAEPIVVTATSIVEDDSPFQRVVLFVDQATKLVISVELYCLQGEQYLKVMTLDYYDYNQPIDPKMFTMDDIPDDVMRVDQTTQEIGLVQGDLTDKEIAVKVIRQFYEAVIAKDYAKAGRLFAGIPAEKIQEMFSDMNVVQIISISEPIPHPKLGVGGFQVHCKIEIEKNGVRSIYEPYGPGVRPVHGQPERWGIHGGVVLIKVLHDNEKYEKMTPKEVAEALFTACAEENWEEFQKYWPGSGHERMKDYLGGLEIISIGEPFQKGAYPGWFVPYEIKLKNGHVKKHNLAIRNDNAAKRYMFDGGI